MKYRKKILFCLIGFLLLCFFVCLTNHFFIIKFSIQSLEDNKYGVIDGNITKLSDNIVYNNDSIVCEDIATLGDNITQFINNLYSNYTIYYYNASIDGEITDKTIIEGLEWMKKNEITFSWHHTKVSK